MVRGLAPAVPCSTTRMCEVAGARSPLGHVALPASGGIGDCDIDAVNYMMYVYDEEENKGAYGRQIANSQGAVNCQQ